MRCYFCECAVWGPCSCVSALCGLAFYPYINDQKSLLFSELTLIILVVTILLFNHSDSLFVSIYWVTEESV